MVEIKQMFLTNKNRPKIKLKKIKGIVIHWTANTGKGANAIANRNYFNSTERLASAHFIVDDRNIIQCIPEDEVAWHVGSDKYRDAGRKLSENGYGPNYFTIGIEMCVNSDGNWIKTYQNTVELAACLLRKYNLNTNDLYRHYDITGKDCPKMMIDESEWLKFKNAVDKLIKSKNQSNTLSNNIEKIGIVTADVLNCREQPSVTAKINGKLKKDTKVKIYEEKNGWYLINKNLTQWVNKEYIKILQ